MRPLVLTLRAFGPFAGEVRVDFARRGGAPFLLINGPTGAGKTSLLDGLCFALYGKASGEARAQNDHFLRSQRARPEDECVASLRFQVGDRRFFVERKPAQTVRSRGKDVERQQRVAFFELDEADAPKGERLARVGEVNARVEELVGFTAEQFRQVMVLPQGEFRRLLLAKSDEKEKILQRLFGTEKYKLAEEILKRRRADLKSRLEELRARGEGVLSAQQATGEDELQARHARLTETRREGGAALAAARVVFAEAQAAQARGQAAERDFVERDVAVAELSRLLEGEAAVRADAAKAERAFRALEHAPLDDEIARDAADAQRLAAELARLDGELEALALRREKAAQALESARAERAKGAERAAERERLAAKLTRLRELETATRGQEDAAKREAQARGRAEAETQALARVDARLTELAAGVEELSLRAGVAEGLARDMERLEASRKGRATLDGLTRDHAAAQAARDKAEASSLRAADEFAQARVALESLRRAQLAGRAAHLAAHLAEGAPCPVCGSLAHPRPAVPAEDTPSDEDIARAESALATREAEATRTGRDAEAARTRLAALESAVGQCREGLGGEADVSTTEWERRLAEVKTARDGALAAEERLAGLRKAREVETKRRAGLAENCTRAGSEAAEAASALAGARAVRERLAGEIAGELGGGDAGKNGVDAAAAQKRMDDLDRLMPAAEKAFATAEGVLAGADKRLEAARGERAAKAQAARELDAKLAERRETFERRLLTDGFNTREDWTAARLPRGSAQALRDAAARFDQRLAAARDRVERAEKPCAGRERPAMTALDAAMTAAAGEVERRSREQGELAKQAEGLEAALRALRESGERSRELERQYSVVGRLADLAAGNNAKNMSLQRYVLAAMFEEVARAASARLAGMSRNRYRLVRADTLRDGRVSGGLDLDVFDANIGKERPAATLSGGESFLASLALALGLSDVVTAQRGGRRLDSIFIDEGFGSLDGETLEFALNTLMELHGAGRLIGIISHVAELRERIDARIDVLPGREGSVVRQVNC